MAGTQPKLPGTLPSPAVAARNHRDAVKKVREAETIVDNLSRAAKEARAALKLSHKSLRAAEDDLDAIAEGRRPD